MGGRVLNRIGKFLGSVGFGNTLLLLILTLSGVNLYTNGRILESSRVQENPPMSTTYVDADGQSHTVTSPTQANPQRNAEVHMEYLKAAFCVFPPMTNPDWFSPERDCPR